MDTCTDTDDNIVEFRRAWRALRVHRSVFLEVQIPDSRFGIRVHIDRRGDASDTGPHTVSLRCTIVVAGEQRRYSEDDVDRILTAVLVCRHAVSTLVSAAGGVIVGFEG
jgi:hypothetical protein